MRIAQLAPGHWRTPIVRNAITSTEGCARANPEPRFAITGGELWNSEAGAQVTPTNEEDAVDGSTGG